ncbi:DUF4254 domain-containing protein [Maribacter litopenaei]|uniref:DUF4254 domain-containing protein n=1 Tax=Maribacter litopenaei TaxID=2976127 RepID=A0ABY5Y7L2_9FLAO|nr:DUF4254 domain-containing protein [Maribacter litopenaei]UWX55012.1 DUF4254 domain-containing protein [Maribacter litopenaei]
MFSDFAFKVFEESINTYHEKDDVYQSFNNPYPKEDIAHLLYRKNWIDTVQWHYEDIIRNPDIEPSEALLLKRKIDASNQDRTDLVEYIDSYFLNKYQSVQVNRDATINTESPAWAIDRLSILALKIYHMHEEVERKDASRTQTKMQGKVGRTFGTKKDLSTAIDQLLNDIELGNKYMKVYKQMKMYNDEELNPILRGQK